MHGHSALSSIVWPDSKQVWPFCSNAFGLSSSSVVFAFSFSEFELLSFASTTGVVSAQSAPDPSPRQLAPSSWPRRAVLKHQSGWAPCQTYSSASQIHSRPQQAHLHWPNAFEPSVEYLRCRHLLSALDDASGRRDCIWTTACTPWLRFGAGPSVADRPALRWMLEPRWSSIAAQFPETWSEPSIEISGQLLLLFFIFIITSPISGPFLIMRRPCQVARAGRLRDWVLDGLQEPGLSEHINIVYPNYVLAPALTQCTPKKREGARGVTRLASCLLYSPYCSLN